jgi:hypothetical protein
MGLLALLGFGVVSAIVVAVVATTDEGSGGGGGGGGGGGTKPAGDESYGFWSDGKVDGALASDTTYTDVHGRVWAYGLPGAAGATGFMWTKDASPISIMGLTHRVQIESKADNAKALSVAGAGKGTVGDCGGSHTPTHGSAWWWESYQNHVRDPWRDAGR